MQKKIEPYFNIYTIIIIIKYFVSYNLEVSKIMETETWKIFSTFGKFQIFQAKYYY